MTVPSPTRPALDQRSDPRRRTRLRPIKIVTRDRRFLEDGAAIDLSPGGARIRRFGDRALPKSVSVFDEIEATLQAALIVWQVNGEIGLRFTGDPILATRTERARLGGRYYAV